MPAGSIILLVIGVLIYFGVLERVLDRMKMTDRAALGWILAMLAGSFIDIPVVQQPVELTVNVGGALVPVAWLVWLYQKAETRWERNRSLIAIGLTAGIIYALQRLLPAGPEAGGLVEPMYLYALAAGVVGYLFGRSRRAAFMGGTGGMIGAELIHFGQLAVTTTPGRTWLGGAGAFDTIIVAGVLAVGLSEVFGETRERLQGGTGLGE